MAVGDPSQYRQPVVTYADTFPAWVSGSGPELLTRIRVQGERTVIGPAQLFLHNGRMSAAIPARSTDTTSAPDTALWSWVTLERNNPGTFIRWVGRGMRYVQTADNRRTLLPSDNSLIPWRREGPAGISYFSSPEELRRQHPNGFAPVATYLDRPASTARWQGGVLLDERGVPCLRKVGDRWEPLMIDLMGGNSRDIGFGWTDPDWEWAEIDDGLIRKLDGVTIVETYYGVLAYEYDGRCPVFVRNRDLTPTSPFSADPFAFAREYRLRQDIYRVRTDLRRIQMADGGVIEGLVAPDRIPAMNGLRCKESWGEKVGNIAVGVVLAAIPVIGTAYSVAMLAKQVADTLKAKKAAAEAARLVADIQTGAGAASQLGPTVDPVPLPTGTAPDELLARASGQRTVNSPTKAGGAAPILILLALLFL